MTALTAATLDTLSGGRFRLGLGISNPDISEGWYGVPFDRPLGRTREYVEIVRRALDREQVTHDGKHFQLPARGCTATPLKLLTEPVRTRVPIYLAAVGPRNLELAGEIADGWLGSSAPRSRWLSPSAICGTGGPAPAGSRTASRCFPACRWP